MQDPVPDPSGVSHTLKALKNADDDPFVHLHQRSENFHHSKKEEDRMVIPFEVICKSNANAAKISIYAGLKKEDWIHSLRESGTATLCFPDGLDIFKVWSEKSLSNRNSKDEEDCYYGGIFSQWWVQPALSGMCSSNTVKSHDDRNHLARIMTLRDHLPTTSVLCHIICLVTKLLCVSLEKRLFAGAPQYLLSSVQGFSSRYWVDVPACVFRAFMYLGCEKRPAPEAGYKTKTEEEDCAYVSFGRDAAMSVSHAGEDFHVIGLRGLYLEGKHKFSLYPGDILIIVGGSPWSIDLPHAIRSPHSRLLTWPVYSKKNERTPEYPRQVPYFDEYLHMKEVNDQYERDLNESEQCKGRFLINEERAIYNDSPELIEFMQRMRVFPSIYSKREMNNIVRRKLGNGTIFDISSFI